MGYVASAIFPFPAVVRHAVRRVDHYRRLPRPCKSTDFKQEIAELRKNGITIMRNFASSDEITKFRDAWPAECNFLLSPEGTLGLYAPTAEQFEGIGDFFRDPRLEQIAAAYISADVQQFRRSAQWKTHLGPTGAFEMFYHIDTWKHRLKAFLYVDDVTETNGAMQYLQGSHRGLWRLPVEAELASNYKAGSDTYAESELSAYLGCLWPHQVAQLSRQFGLRPVTCEAPAGSLVVFDTRGFHRAKPLLRGQRRLLCSYWIATGHHL